MRGETTDFSSSFLPIGDRFEENGVCQQFSVVVGAVAGKSLRGVLYGSGRGSIVDLHAGTRALPVLFNRVP
jgi:hypothetical protein